MQLLGFLLGVILIIIGMSIFLFGVEIVITPIGTLMGKPLSKVIKLGLWLLPV
ncbi:MAG: DUF1538 family protein [Syntrophomonadaceae bacterium]|jgi:hypothetical protein